MEVCNFGRLSLHRVGILEQYTFRTWPSSVTGVPTYAPRKAEYEKVVDTMVLLWAWWRLHALSVLSIVLSIAAIPAIMTSNLRVASALTFCVMVGSSPSFITMMPRHVLLLTAVLKLDINLKAHLFTYPTSM